MSFHYKQLIQHGSPYNIAKTLQKKMYAPDHEDIIAVLEASMWMLDSLYDKIDELEKKLDTKQDRPIK